MQLDRQPVFIRGAHFFKQDDVDMWAFGIDPNNSLGPRKATAKDRKDYPGEWEAYQRSLFNGADPAAFDHDNSGTPGGDIAAAPKRRGRPPKKKTDE